MLLEVKALREGAWKLSDYIAFHCHLCFVISPELKVLLNIAPKAHPQLQAYLIDLCQYKPTWRVGIDSEAPKSVCLKDEDEAEVLPPELIEDMAMAEIVLQ